MVRVWDSDYLAPIWRAPRDNRGGATVCGKPSDVRRPSCRCERPHISGLDHETVRLERTTEDWLVAGAWLRDKVEGILGASVAGVEQIGASSLPGFSPSRLSILLLAWLTTPRRILPGGQLSSARPVTTRRGRPRSRGARRRTPWPQLRPRSPSPPGTRPCRQLP